MTLLVTTIGLIDSNALHKLTMIIFSDSSSVPIIPVPAIVLWPPSDFFDPPPILIGLNTSPCDIINSVSSGSSPPSDAVLLDDVLTNNLFYSSDSIRPIHYNNASCAFDWLPVLLFIITGAACHTPHYCNTGSYIIPISIRSLSRLIASLYCYPGNILSMSNVVTPCICNSINFFSISSQIRGSIIGGVNHIVGIVQRYSSSHQYINNQLLISSRNI